MGQDRVEEEARKLVARALEFVEGDTAGPRQLAGLGMLHGGTEEALKLVARARDLYRSIAHAEDEAATVLLLADLEVRRGRLEEARRIYGDAFDLYSCIGHIEGNLIVLVNLAVLDHNDGKIVEAQTVLQFALQQAEENSIVDAQAYLLSLLAQVDLMKGDLLGARMRWVRSMLLFRRIEEADKIEWYSQQINTIPSFIKALTVWMTQPALFTDASVLISAVDPASQAEKAGVVPGDVLVSYATTPFDKPETLQEFVRSTEPTKTVAIEVLRGAQKLTFEVCGGSLGLNGFALPSRPAPVSAVPRKSHQDEPIRPREQASQPRAVETTATVKILFVSATPDEKAPIRVDRELRAIRHALRGTPHADAFELISIGAAQTSDLRRALHDHQPQILHISSHGTRTGKIVFEDERARARPVHSHALADLLAAFESHLRLVVLNACSSRTQAEAIVQRIDCAIGLPSTIADKPAIEFAAAFYEALSFGLPIQKAFEIGVSAARLHAAQPPDPPELFTREGVDPTTLIFARHTPPEPPRPNKATLLSISQTLAVLAPLGFVAYLLAQNCAPRETTPAPPNPSQQTLSSSAASAEAAPSSSTPPLPDAPSVMPNRRATYQSSPRSPSATPASSALAEPTPPPATAGTATCQGSQCTLRIDRGTFDGTFLSVCLKPAGGAQRANCLIQGDPRGHTTVKCDRSDREHQKPLEAPVTWSRCP